MASEEESVSVSVTAIEVSDENEAIAITWEDGHMGVFPWGFLRGACPCVLCKRSHRGVDISSIEPVEGVWLVDWMPVGTYAVRLLWSDAHETGIYSFDYLRTIAGSANA